MKIKRDGKEIELTKQELWEAHEEFVTDWMTTTAREIVSDLYECESIDKIPSYDVLREIGSDAFSKYCDGNGLTEYECVQFAVDEYYGFD